MSQENNLFCGKTLQWCALTIDYTKIDDCHLVYKLRIFAYFGGLKLTELLELQRYTESNHTEEVPLDVLLSLTEHNQPPIINHICLTSLTNTKT